MSNDDEYADFKLSIMVRS